MIISRQLRIALLVSFFWHLFWMSSVSIVFLPSGFKLRQYSTVNFLGSILSSHTSVKWVSLPRKHSVKFPPEADIQRLSYFNQRLNTSLPVEKETLSPDSFIDLDALAKEASLPAPDFVLSKAQAHKREIIFQPPLPKYPEVDTQQELTRGSDVIFKVYISAEGLVEQAINLQASGNPEIDAALVRYIRKWRFAPSVDQQGQWQTVKINLDIE